MSSGALSQVGNEAYFDIVGEQKAKLGEGSFGTVYKHARTDKPGTEEYLAVKVISVTNRQHQTDPEMARKLKQRVEHEIAVHQQLEHRNVVQFFAVKQTVTAAGDHETRIILEHCNQGDLSEYLDARGSLPVPDRVIIDIFTDMQSGIEYLEAQGILHRDIKPENVFRHRAVTATATATATSTTASTGASAGAAADAGAMAEHRVVHKLGDFGLARTLQTDTKAMSRIGTAPWAAPEVTARDGDGYSHECDRFSFGALMYKCEYGVMLFPGRDSNGKYKDSICRDEVKAFTGVLPDVPDGRWDAANGPAAALVTTADTRSLRGVVRQIICGLLKPNISERTTCAQLKAQVNALKHPVLVLDVKSSRVLEVHVPCCDTAGAARPSVRVPQSAIKPVSAAGESLGQIIMASLGSGAGGGAGGAAASSSCGEQATVERCARVFPTITPPTMEAVKAVLRAPPYSMEGAELRLLHPDNDAQTAGTAAAASASASASTTAAAAAGGIVPLLLIDGAGYGTSFGCDGTRSKYPPLPSSSSGADGADWGEVRGSSLELADTADYDFGPECCCHLAAATVWTTLAATLLKDTFAKTVDDVRVTVNTLVDARASAIIATEQVFSFRKTAKEKFKGLKVVGTTLYSAIYEGQKEAAPPLYDSEDMQNAAFSYLQKQPTALAVMRPNLKVLEDKTAELVAIATASAAGADTIVIMREQDRYRNAKSAIEAHTEAMSAMSNLCDNAVVGITNGEKFAEHIAEKKDAAVANKCASLKELEKVQSALFEHLVEYIKLDNVKKETSAAADDAAALRKDIDDMNKQLLEEAQVKGAQARQEAAVDKQRLIEAQATAEQACKQKLGQVQAEFAVKEEERAAELAMLRSAAAAAASSAAAAAASSNATAESEIGVLQKDVGTKTALLASQQSELVQQAKALAAVQSASAALRAVAATSGQAVATLTTKLKAAEAQEAVRTSSRVQMLELHDGQGRELAAANRRVQLLEIAASTAGESAAAKELELAAANQQAVDAGLRAARAEAEVLELHDGQGLELDAANQRVQLLETNIRKCATEVALAASTSGELAAAKQQADDAGLRAARAEAEACTARQQRLSERQGAEVMIAELATMRAEVGSRPVVGRMPAAADRVILVKQTTGRWIVAGIMPEIQVQLNPEADWQSKTRLPFVFAVVVYVEGRTVVVEKIRGPSNELIATT